MLLNVKITRITADLLLGAMVSTLDVAEFNLKYHSDMNISKFIKQFKM
jgi:hypothetical protein